MTGQSTPRTTISIAKKRRIYTLANGKCGCGCGERVPMTGQDVRWDHRISLFMGGLDDWPNLRPVLTIHDKPKTASDQTVIAKVKRIIRKASGNWRPNRKKIPARANPWPKSRGFQKRPS